MRALVIGYGSIGARHARILQAQGHNVHCVTQNAECPFPMSDDLIDALTHFSPEVIIISNRTVDHSSSLDVLKNKAFSGPILVEKPLFHTLPKTLPHETSNIFTAYNLRFHPIVERVSAILKGKKLYSAQFHVGQYLPDWRPGTDYTASYSAHRNQGGGVLRDLSHELDLALYLLGPWQRVTALGGHLSSLDISSDDVFTTLLETEGCPAVTIHMDYLNRTPRRGFDINAEGISLHADFIAGHLDVNGIKEEFTVDRDDTYTAQITALTSKETSPLCTFLEGTAVLKLIDSIERSACERTWINAS